MIALVQIRETALVSGLLALHLLSETEPTNGPDCTRWRLAFVAVAILAIFLVAIVVWLLVKRRSVGIRWIGTIALVYLSGPSISLVVRSLGVEFNVPGAGWPGVIVTLAAIGAIAFHGWHHHSRPGSDPLAEHIDVVFEGFRVGKKVQELADELGVPKTHITTIYWQISKIRRWLD